MLKVEIGGTVHGQIWDVELTYMPYAHGKWQITINKAYNGSMWKIDGEWRFGINDNSQLTTTDIYLLGQIIEEHIRQVQMTSGI